MGFYDYGYPAYVSVAQKRAKAKRQLEKLRKKNPNLRPIVLEGSALTRTWWGKAWNKNLERYADFSNRIGRGRSYVRHGAVLDLQIAPGKVTALVQGSRSKPYNVDIDIKSITKTQWQTIVQAVGKELSSLEQLLEGRFPKALETTFTKEKQGLFPTPREISLKCSCPDWATMCKHVAAALYGIGTRLDEDPLLFFVLRQAKVEDLITQAVQDQSDKLLKQAKRKSTRVIDDSELGDVFGIDLDTETKAVPKHHIKTSSRQTKKAAAPKRKTAKKKVVKKKAAKTAKKVSQKKTQKPVKKPAKKVVKKVVKKKVAKKTKT
ncbi:MAG: hypothetical protein K9N55_12900 [Phycisphaerae bacterium]|nr:hypothetical protein [Phycisphaerae bacterium]